MRRIGFSGLFDIEIFRVGERFVFNEMNWRNSAVCFAAIASGVEYPLYWCESVLGRKVTIAMPEEYGVYAMNELLDFQHVKNKELSFKKWFRQLRNSKAKAYYDKTDRKPLRKRFWMFFRRRIS